MHREPSDSLHLAQSHAITILSAQMVPEALLVKDCLHAFDLPTKIVLSTRDRTANRPEKSKDFLALNSLCFGLTHFGLLVKMCKDNFSFFGPKLRLIM